MEGHLIKIPTIMFSDECEVLISPIQSLSAINASFLKKCFLCLCSNRAILFLALVGTLFRGLANNTQSAWLCQMHMKWACVLGSFCKNIPSISFLISKQFYSRNSSRCEIIEVIDLSHGRDLNQNSTFCTDVYEYTPNKPKPNYTVLKKIYITLSNRLYLVLSQLTISSYQCIPRMRAGTFSEC